MATYKHIRSSTAHKRPTTAIADGQIAINTNTASPGLFFKDSAGTGIVKVGPVHVGTTAPNSTPAAGGSSGNYLGEQWLDTGVSPAQMKVWNGSAWVAIVADELPVAKLQDGAAGQIIQTDATGTGVEWSNTTNLPLGTATAPAYSFQGDSNTGIYSPGADQVALSTGGTGRLFISSTGNVGIGTTSSAGELHIAGSDANTDILLTEGGSSTDNRIRNSNGVLLIDSDLNNEQGGSAIVFGVDGSEKLRINSIGLVGIGTSAPTALLDVSSNVLRLRTSKTPASATDTGNAGDICWDANYIYVCIATNTWKRAALSTW